MTVLRVRKQLRKLRAIGSAVKHWRSPVPPCQSKNDLSTSSKWPSTLKPYALGEQIGQGTFGEVYVALLKPNGEACAMKVVRMRDKFNLHSTMNEIRLLEGKEHVNLVKLLTVFVVEDWICIVMPLLYCVGEIVLYRKRFKRYGDGIMEKSALASALLQTANGLNFLHTNRIVHFDIKAGNLLIDDTGCIKIADFGLSHLLNNTTDRHQLIPVGTPGFTAPEVLFGDRRLYPLAPDIWSFGTMIGELICGQFVPSFYENHFKRSQQMFEGDRGQLILAELVYGQLDEDNLVEQYGKKMCYLAQSCLRISPRERISIGQIIEHPALECASRSALIKTLLRKAYKDVCHQRIAHGARQFKSQRQFTEGDRQGPGAMTDTNRAQFEQMLNVLDESVPVPRFIHERLHPDTELEQAGKYIAVRITFALCPFRSLATSHVFIVAKNASPWQSDGEVGKHVYALCKRKIVSIPDFFTISPRISDQLHSARLKDWKGGQVQQVIRLKQYDGEYDRYRLNGYIQVNLEMEPSTVLKWMKHYGTQFENGEDGVKEEEQRTPRVHHEEQPIAVFKWMKHYGAQFESGEDGVKEETDHQ